MKRPVSLHTSSHPLSYLILSYSSQANAKNTHSQGAAIVHRAIEGLNATIRDRIAGVVTFGDTQTAQDGGRILGYPASRTLIICNYGDVICAGALVPVYPVHWDYVKWVPTATLFLTQTVLAAAVLDPWPYYGNDSGSGGGGSGGGENGIGGLMVDLRDVGELGPGVEVGEPVPTRFVAFPEGPVPTGTGMRMGLTGVGL